MKMRNKYDIQIRKLVFMLLPTFLRKPFLVTFFYSIVAPVCEIYTRFVGFREDNIYRMRYNGQICHLRAVLNDHFDPVQRRITISDEPDINNAFISMREINELPPMLKREINDKNIIYKREENAEEAYDFCVNLPSSLSGKIDDNNIKTVVNMYKLTSKRFKLIYV